MSAPRGTSYGLIFLLWVAGLTAAAQFAKITITLAHLNIAYPNTSVDVTFAFSVVGIVGIFFGLTAGVVVGRLGFRRILIFALILGVAMSGVQALLPPFPVFLLSRVVEGVSHLCIVVAAPTLMIQLSAPRYHAIVMGFWASFFGISYALTGWLGLKLLEIGGPGAVFATHAGAMAGVAVVAAVFLPHRLVQEASADVRDNTPFWRVWISAHKNAYMSLPISAPGGIFFWQTMMFIALITFLPEFADAEYRILMITMMPVASIVGALAAGFIAQRLSPTLPGMIGFLSVSGIIVLMYFELGNGVSYAALAIVLMGVSGMVQGAVFALVPALNADGIAQAWSNGTIAQMGNLGTAIGTPIFAAVIGFGGFRALVSTVLVLGMAGSISLVLVGAHRRLMKTR